MALSRPAAEAGLADALACRNVTVRYGNVTALRDVSVAFAAGRIHAVVGQNGAGKTTFARVCAGIVQPTAGTLTVAGAAVAAGRVGAARRAGVELVHQSFALPPSFTVAEALEFGSDLRGAPVFGRRALSRRWRAHLERLDVSARLSDRIRDLPVETQQGVEIARALAGNARVLILDEPTAVLAPPGIALLFDRLRRLRTGGVTIVLILHKVREVLAIAESIAVLRGGELVAERLEAAALSAEGLAQAIVGPPSAPAPDTVAPEGPGRACDGYVSGAVRAATVEAPSSATPTAALLVCDAARTRATPDAPALEDISLTVGPGEIVGIAGVEGNGQRSLVNVLAGIVALRAGRITLDGSDVSHASLLERRRHGLRIIPFDRNHEGLSVTSALWQNWAARSLADGPLLQPVNPAALRAASKAAFERWNVRFASVDQPAGSLSGGNAQKVVLAREIDAGARLIVAAQPTRGLDIAATSFVWRALRDARARGCGVLLISSDLDELFDISDRIVVLLSGRIVATFSPPYSAAALGSAMAGLSA